MFLKLVFEETMVRRGPQSISTDLHLFSTIEAYHVIIYYCYYATRTLHCLSSGSQGADLISFIAPYSLAMPLYKMYNFISISTAFSSLKEQESLSSAASLHPRAKPISRPLHNPLLPRRPRRCSFCSPLVSSLQQSGSAHRPWQIARGTRPLTSLVHSTA